MVGHGGLLTEVVTGEDLLIEDEWEPGYRMARDNTGDSLQPRHGTSLMFPAGGRSLTTSSNSLRKRK